MPERFHSSSDSSPHDKGSKEKKTTKQHDKKKSDKKEKKEKKPKKSKSKKTKTDEDEEEGTDDCHEPLEGGGNDDDEDDGGMFDELEGLDGLLDVKDDTKNTKKRPASSSKTQPMKRPSKKRDDDLESLEAWCLPFAKLKEFS